MLLPFSGSPNAVASESTVRDQSSSSPLQRRASLRRRRSLADVLDQEAGKFSIQIKFRPTLDLLHRCEEYMTEGFIHVPVQIIVPNQTLPVFFHIRAFLTSSDIQFDPPRLDFGYCYTSQVNEFFFCFFEAQTCFFVLIKGGFR